METPYVVKLHQMYAISEPKACWTFRHPNRAAHIDNTRYVHLEFPVSIKASTLTTGRHCL
jgi:hypothetical protein